MEMERRGRGGGDTDQTLTVHVENFWPDNNILHWMLDKKVETKVKAGGDCTDYRSRMKRSVPPTPDQRPSLQEFDVAASCAAACYDIWISDQRAQEAG